MFGKADSFAPLCNVLHSPSRLSTMCRIGRERRRKYEGTDEEGASVSRTNKEWKWDEDGVESSRETTTDSRWSYKKSRWIK